MLEGDWAIQYILRYRSKLSRKQLKTLIGQAKKGDPDGAVRGLRTLLSRLEGAK